MNYYYKEKGWFYFGFKYSESLINELQKRFKAQFNPANKEWYVKAELWNISYINEFIEENNFVEQYPEREREIELPLSSDVFDVDVTKALVSELGLQRKPRDYQYEGIAYMLNHENTINGCDVGLGKSATTITYLELLDLFPCIIVCPSTVKSGWKKEWGIINPSRSVSIIGTKKKKDWDADVIIINYDLLGSSTKYINKKGEEKRKVEVKFPEFFLREYHAIVADEIHLLKNSKAIRSKAFRLLSKGIERIIGLSGTLIMNRPSELYNILQITGWYNKIFPDWEYYYYRYCNLKISEYGRDSSCSSNVKELYEILSHYCYFRKEKREVLTELPPIIEQVFEIELSNKKAYKKAEEDLIEYLSNIDLEKIEKALRAQTLVQLNILFQLSIEGKMKQIELYIKEWLEANEDSKLLVFGIHKDPLIKLASCFDESCLITGDLSLANKEKEKDAFIERKDKRVLFANIQCIGTGVDGLQKVCSNGIFIELPVRPSELVQAIGRIERMGQKDSINISYLLSPDSVDMKIWDMLKTKKNITDQVIKGYEDDVSLGLLKSYVRET